MHLDEFRVTYPAFLPKRTPGDPDECVQMTTEDGLRLLVGPTDEPIKIDQAPDNADDAAIGRYLWVIGTTACPHGLERGPFGQARRLGQMKHTNLTGGSEAHCGGELWFLTDDRVLLNGDSGRYGPSSEKQLHDAACCLKALGYRAGYLRFNEGNKPRSIATGEEDIVWL